MKKRRLITRMSLIAGLFMTSLFVNAQEYFNSTTYGDNYQDMVFGTSMDSENNLYLAGHYSGSITVGATTITYIGGNVDAYLTKFDSEGNPLTAYSFGGQNDAAALAVANDNEGNVYLTGYFMGAGPNAFDADPGPDEYLLEVLSFINSRDAFIIKLDAEGNFVWAKQISNTFGAANEDTYAIKLDSENNVYVAGRFIQADFDTDETGSELIMAEGENYDGFLLKLDNDGNTIWVKTFKSPDISSVSSMDIDEDDNITVGGIYIETLKPDPNDESLVFTSQGGSDAFFVRLNSDGEYLEGNSIGGTENDEIKAVRNHSGNTYVGGYFRGSVDFDPDPSGEDFKTSNGGSDSFISKFDSSGDYIFSYTLGSENDIEEVEHISVGMNNEISLSGDFAGTVDFDAGTEEAITTSNGGMDNYILQISEEGEYLNHATLGSSENEAKAHVNYNSENNIILAGNYSATINLNPFDGEPAYAENMGYHDVYVSRFNLGAALAPQLTINPGSIEFPDTFIGNTSTQTLTLTNTGNDVLMISDMVTTQDVFTTTNTSLDIEPGASEEIEISFSPEEQILYEGNLIIVSNNPGSNIFVPLTGQGDSDISVPTTNTLNNINIYPNPVQGTLYIENAQNSQISIYNTQGILIQTFTTSSTSHQIDLSNLAHGIYLVRFSNKNEVMMKRLVIGQ